MKNKLLKTALLLSLFAFIILSNSTCKKAINEHHNCPQGQHWDNARQTCVDDSVATIDTTSNILNDTTILVDSINVISSSESSVTINTSNFSKQPTVGCILIAPPCANAQYGFMRKVTSISGDKSNLKCETEYCGLNEAFRQLNFNYTSSTLFSSSYNAAIATQLLNSSGNVSNGGAGILDSIMSVSLNFSNKTLVPGLILNGTLKFNILSIKYKYDKDKSILDPKYVLMKADYNTEGSNLSVEFDGSEIKLPEDTVHIFDLPTFRIPIPIPTPVGVIVIPYPFTEKIYATILPLTIKGKLKLQIVPIFHGTLGCEYSNGSWKNISTVVRDTLNTNDFCKKDFLISEAITSTLTLFNFRYTIAPLGVASLNTYLQTPSDVTLTIQTNSPNYSLQYGLNANVGVELPTFWGIKTKFQANAKLFDTTLAKGNWSSCGDTISLSTNQVTSITASSAISGGNITDSGGSPIIQRGVCWNTSHNPTINDSKTNDGTGNGSFVSNITGLIANTTYYVRAYAANSVGTTYGNEVSFNTGIPWTGSGWRHYDIYISGGYDSSFIFNNWPLIVSFNVVDSTINGTTDLGDGYKIPTSGTISTTNISFECSTKSYNTHGELNDLDEYKFTGSSSGNNIYEGIWSQKHTDYLYPQNNVTWSGHFYLPKN